MCHTIVHFREHLQISYLLMNVGELSHKRSFLLLRRRNKKEKHAGFPEFDHFQSNCTVSDIFDICSFMTLAAVDQDVGK